MSTPRPGGLRPFRPTHFGRFTLLAPLAAGGMGQIYLARASFHGGLEKLCVIKKVLPQLSRDPDFVARFLDEARTLVELQHGSIAQVYDTGVENGEYWIALEFVDGKDLRRLLQRLRERNARMPLPMALLVGIKVLEALAYAHRKKDAAGRELGLVHRDVSPQNILLSYEGEVKVIDFGLARSKLSAEGDPSVVMGKFHYMAPEQARNEPLDRRADLYALGVVLYELITGWNPFEDAPPAQVMEWAAWPRIPPLERLAPGIPAAVSAAIGRALAMDPAGRFATAEEMRSALAACLAEIAPGAGPEELASLLRSEFEADHQRERAWIASFASGAIEPAPVLPAAGGAGSEPPQLGGATMRFDSSETKAAELPWNRDQSSGSRALRSAAAAAGSTSSELPWYESGPTQVAKVPPPPDPEPTPQHGLPLPPPEPTPRHRLPVPEPTPVPVLDALVPSSPLPAEPSMRKGKGAVWIGGGVATLLLAAAGTWALVGREPVVEAVVPPATPAATAAAAPVVQAAPEPVPVAPAAPVAAVAPTPDVPAVEKPADAPAPRKHAPTVSAVTAEVERSADSTPRRPYPEGLLTPRSRLVAKRRAVQARYDALVREHGEDQVGAIVAGVVRAVNSQFDRLIDDPAHYGELQSQLDDLDRLLEERRAAFRN